MHHSRRRKDIGICRCKHISLFIQRYIRLAVPVGIHPQRGFFEQGGRGRHWFLGDEYLARGARGILHHTRLGLLYALHCICVSLRRIGIVRVYDYKDTVGGIEFRVNLGFCLFILVLIFRRLLFGEQQGTQRETGNEQRRYDQAGRHHQNFLFFRPVPVSFPGRAGSVDIAMSSGGCGVAAPIRGSVSVEGEATLCRCIDLGTVFPLVCQVIV